MIVVKALAELPDKDKFVFVVCGHETTSDPVAQELVDLSEKGGVQTVFIGFHSDMPEVIAACADIGVMPSLREGLGMAGLEMLCEGVPLVGSDVQGIREYLKDGVTGFLCNPFSVEDFKNGIQKLADPDLRRRMKPDCKAMAENSISQYLWRSAGRYMRKYSTSNDRYWLVAFLECLEVDAECECRIHLQRVGHFVECVVVLCD